MLIKMYLILFLVDTFFQVIRGKLYINLQDMLTQTLRLGSEASILFILIETNRYNIDTDSLYVLTIIFISLTSFGLFVALMSFWRYCRYEILSE